MIKESEKQLIFKFLERNFPVVRIKHDRHFRRAIILDDGTPFLLGDGSQRYKLKFRLLETLTNVFSYDQDVNSAILDNFLRLT